MLPAITFTFVLFVLLMNDGQAGNTKNSVIRPQIGNKINPDFAEQNWQPNPPIYKARFNWIQFSLLVFESGIILAALYGFFS